MKARHLLLLAAALAGFLWQAIDFTNHPVFAQAAAPVAPKRPVYVRDFLFDSQNLKPDEGLLGRREGPVGRLLRGLKPSEDPAAKARELVTLLSNTIVAELNNAGIRATRLEPGALMPQDGLLVGGEFLEVDEGNRMRRAMVGFGAGSEEIKVQVEVYDLAQESNCAFSCLRRRRRGPQRPRRRRVQKSVRSSGALRAFAQGDREGRREAGQSDRHRPRKDIRRIQIRSDPVKSLIAARVFQARNSAKNFTRSFA